MNVTSHAVANPRRRGLAAIALGCAAVGVLGLVVAPRETWSGYLVAFGAFSGLALAGPLFLAIHNLTGARWSGSLVPVAEAMTRTLPVAGCIGLGLLCGVPSLYEWSHPETVAGAPLLRHKAAWLSVSGYALRLIACFVLWTWLGHRLIGTASPDVAAATRIRRSTLFMAVFAVTYSLAAVDWFQSLEPHWFSTIYALIGLAGIASSGLAVVMIAAVVLRRTGAIPRDDDQLDDLGKIGLSLSLFWVYVVFCQYMLVWYTNNPEETPWYEIRHRSGWQALTMVDLGLNWLVPFLVLMPRAWRRSESVILRTGVVMLAGRLVDLFVMIMPPLLGAQPRLGPFEAAPIAGASFLFALVFLPLVRRRNPIASVP